MISLRESAELSIKFLPWIIAYTYLFPTFINRCTQQQYVAGEDNDTAYYYEIDRAIF